MKEKTETSMDPLGTIELVSTSQCAYRAMCPNRQELWFDYGILHSKSKIDLSRNFRPKGALLNHDRYARIHVSKKRHSNTCNAQERSEAEA